MRQWIRRLKETMTRDWNALMEVDSVSAKTVLIKWFFIGLILFLLVLFTFLQISFAPKETPVTEETLPDYLEDEEIIEVDEGPMHGFEEEDLPVMDSSEELVLKDKIWQELMADNYQAAADLAYDAVHSQSFEESSDFINWYHDIYKVATVRNIATEDQHVMLTSFEVPRFQAVFPTYTSVMTLATMVDDPDSLLPIDVKSVQVLDEEIVNPEDCEGISSYIDGMLIHFKSVYKGTIAFNGEILTAYVGIFNSGHLKLLGYYGEFTQLKTDSYWESKRLDYAQNPNF